METVPIDSDKLVVLKFDGDFEHQGFRVTLEIGLDGHRPRVEEFGNLPAAPHLETHLAEFKHLYRKLGGLTRVIRPQLVLSQETPRSRLNQCRQKGEELAEAFLAWLNSDSFQPLDRRLREELSRQDRIRVLVRSRNPTIQQMPWHRWDFIDRYPNSEVVFGAFSAESPDQGLPDYKQTVRILAIFGNGSGLDLNTDRQILESIPNAEITALVEPSRAEFKRALWQGSWDILFFAGHSRTDQSIGQLFLSPNEALSLSELTYGLREGIRKGLKLAIFNSCDGLGLAYALQQINLPQIIVMRELVPDQLAHEFLQTFLAEFAAGHALHLAQRRAREQLEDWEDKFPHANWLPVVVQNPAFGPLTWQQLIEPKIDYLYATQQQTSDLIATDHTSQQRWWNWSSIKKATLIAVLVASFVVGIRSLGILQIPELKAYDHLTRLRPLATSDERLLVITVDEKDIAYTDFRQMSRKEGWSLSDQALEQLLNILNTYEPAAIGLDIYHPYPFEPTLAQLIKDTKMLIGICEMDHSQSLPEYNSPPPGLSENRLGYSDLAIDPDNFVRRQILLMTSGAICKTSQSLSLQVAEQYLAKQNYSSHDLEDIKQLSQNIERLPNGLRRLGDFIFPRLQFNSGGYQLPPQEAAGYQILINTQYAPPKTIALREILDPSTLIDPSSLINNRAILIGVNQNYQDRHMTAPDSIDSTPGVIIHAHMVSQLLDAVIDKEGIMHWWPEWLETIWIFGWALLAGYLTSVKVSKLWLGISITFILLTLFLTCFIFFCFDIWIPLIPPVLAVMIGAISTLFSRQLASIWSPRR